MNIFMPLLAGIAVGRLLRARGKRTDLTIPMSAALLLMIFFMGVKTGKVSINAAWLLSASIVFAVLTVLGSLGMALLIGGGRR